MLCTINKNENIEHVIKRKNKNYFIKNCIIFNYYKN